METEENFSFEEKECGCSQPKSTGMGKPDVEASTGTALRDAR
jgi:hypothetical protein